MLFNSNFIQILNHYAHGYFPTLDNEKNFFYYKPETRPILPISGMRVTKSLKRTINKKIFNVKYNHNFDQVIRNCIRKKDNWITPEIIHVYKYLNKIGHAHSVECYNDGKLVGGLYGLALGAGFFIESMFSLESDASKVAVYYLLEELKKQNFEFCDLQIMSEHLKTLGAIELSKDTFDITLNRSLKIKTKWGKDINSIQNYQKFNIQLDDLTISQIDLSDREKIIELSQNKEMHRFTLMRPISCNDSFENFYKDALNANRNGIPDSLSIRRKTNGEYIGTLFIFYPNTFLPTIEIAIEISPQHWGKGYGKKIFKKAIEFTKEAYPVSRIQARAVPENLRSNKMLLSAGYELEGKLKNAYYYKRIYDLNYYGIKRDLN